MSVYYTIIYALIPPHPPNVSPLIYMILTCPQGKEIELAVKCGLLLLRVHHNQFVSTGALIESITTLRRHARLRLNFYKDITGLNLAALQFLSRNIEETETQHLFGDPEEAAAKKRRRMYNTKAHRKKLATKKHRPPR